MATKQPPNYWAEWRDIKRFNHPVTVAHVRDNEVALGLDREIKIKAEIIRREKGVVSGLWYLWTVRHERQWIADAKAKVKNYESPAKMVQKIKKLNPMQSPHITWYAYLLDFLMNNGWSESEVNNLAWSALSEVILTIDSRRVNDSTRRTIEANPSPEGLKEIGYYSKRLVEIPADIRIAIWRAEKAKFMNG